MSRMTRLFLVACVILPAITCFSQNITNKGKEFWVGYGHHQFMEGGGNDQDMVIYLSAEEKPANVTITIDSSGIIPALWWRRTYHIPAYTVISIANNLTPAVSYSPASARAYGPIPKGPLDAANAGTDPNFDARLYTDPPPAGTGGAGLFRKKGIHIQSDVPIVAYAHIYGSASSGATMLLPVEAWGYSYVSVNSRQSYASNCYSWMYVIAQKDNTVVEITPSVITRSQNTTGLRPGQPTLVTLMKGQIYQIIGANNSADANGNNGASSEGRELTGTKVRSVAGPTGECYPIAVFAGSSRTYNEISCGTGGGDNDNQQLFPTHAWGKRYVTAPFSNSTSASSFTNCSYKIIVKDPTTQVKRNGVVLTGMDPAGYYFFESRTADYIEADKPIQVAQFMTGGSCLGGGVGDPEMIVLSPIEQATNRVGFYRNTEEFIDVNYLTLIIPDAGVSSLRIDNSAVFSYTYPHPNLPGYTVVVKRWGPSAQAQCIVSSDSSFNAITYGLGSVESYGYNAGTNINNLNAIGSVHNQLDPTVSENPFTCVNTPVELSVLMAYQPTRLRWQLSSLASVLTPNDDVTQNSPVSTGTVTVDGIPYYKYTLPGTYLFSTADTFEVSIFATSPTVENCNNTEEIKISYIVKERPKPDFTFTHTGCTLDTVYFTGENLAGGGFSLGQWNWEFPSSVTASGQNIKQVLPPGTHNIKLTGISNEGCVGDTTKTLTVHPKPTATFGITPPAVCFGQEITLSDTSSYAGTSPPITNWYWDLGDGQELNNPNANNVTVNYAVPNTYTVRHAVKVSDLCVSDTVVKTVVISPEARIEFTYPKGCLPTSGNAQFGASAADIGGAPIVSYNWDFGDPASGANNASTAQNPSHNYASYGTYPVTLSIITNTGCAGDTTVDLAFGVRAALDYTPLSDVCVDADPFSVANGNITNGVNGTGEYHGPGTDISGIFDPAAAGPGTHTIWYVFTAEGGCKDSVSATITVNALPNKPVTTASITYCKDASASTLTATAASGNTLTWYDNDALTGGSSTAPVPVTNIAGTYYYYVTQTNSSGCTSDTSKITVIVLDPITGNNIGADQTICGGTTPATLTAIGNLSGGTGSYSYQWQQSIDGGANWSDIGTATSTTFDPPAVNGTTEYRRVVMDGFCSNISNIVTITIQGSLSSYNISADQSICDGSQPALLDGETPIGGSGTFSYEWENSEDAITWSIIPGTASEDYLPPAIATKTYYRRKLTSGVCSATSNTVQIAVNPSPNGTITGPAAICAYDAADISFTASEGVAPFTIQLNITAPSGTISTITRTIADNGPVSINVIPANSDAGNYTIALASITDNTGCSRTTNLTTLNILVNAQPVVTIDPVASACEGTSVSLTANGATDYTWSPSTGLSSANGNAVNASPAATTTYTVTGTTDGCTGTATVTVEINPQPQASFTVDNGICENETATIQNTSTIPSGNITTWNWDIGDGNTPVYNNGNPFIVSYPGPDTYTIQLITISDKGCSSLPATKTISVNPLPIADFDLPAAICMPGGNAEFVNNSSVPDNSTLTYLWDFGDGATSGAVNPSHIYAAVGSYDVKLTATSAFGCSSENTQTINDFFDKPIAAFEVTPDEICQGAEVSFADHSTAPNSTVQEWRWDFGDNTSSTLSQPIKQFNSAGSYDVQLKVINAVGCSSDPVTKPVLVHIQPVIDAGQSFVVSEGTEIHFTATANYPGLTFNWDPPTGLNDPASLNPSLIASADRTYTLTATGDFGCTASDFMTVKILKEISVPNTFSPNGDNIHDKWMLPNLADYPGCTVEIFNRYGQQVFYSTGYSQPWDGTFKGKDLPVGTYYYIIQLKNGFKPITGPITIVR